MLHINGESTQGLTHAQVVERIRASGPRLCLVLSRPPKTHPGKPEGVGGSRKEDGGFPGERGQGSVRGRKGFQGGEAGVLSKKGLASSVGKIGGLVSVRVMIVSKWGAERVGSHDRKKDGFRRGGF